MTLLSHCACARCLRIKRNVCRIKLYIDFCNFKPRSSRYVGHCGVDGVNALLHLESLNVIVTSYETVYMYVKYTIFANFI